MAKLTLASFASLQSGSAVTALNNNFAAIITAFENTLSRDGTSPNYMSDNLDMNSNRISNLVPAIGDTEPVRLKEFQDGMDALEVIVQDIASTTQGYLNTVATIYDDFDDRYLGPKASDPSVDNDGNALLTGALYWNTSTNITKVWTGTQWTGVISTTSGFMLDDLGDVVISSAASGDVLRHDGSSWVDYDSANFLARANHTGTQLSTTISDFTEAAQDATGAMVDSTLVYTDGTPLLSRAALTGAITVAEGSNETALGSFTLASLNTAVSDADLLSVAAAAAAYQPLDADLTTIAGLTATTDNFMQAKSGEWASRTIEQVKTDLLLTGTNSGDQTSIVGITGTKAQFDTAVTDGNILYVGDVTQYTDELAQDAVGAMVDSTLVYVDGTPTLGRAALTGHITVASGSNASLLGSFTMAQLDAAVSDGNVSYDTHTHSGLAPAGGTINQVLKKNSGTDYDYSWAADATGGGGLSDADYGDITVSAGATVFTIDNDVVSNAKAANMATATIKGRVTAATGDPEDLTGTQATTLLDVFTSGLKGLAPLSGGGTTNFLRADGTWAAPSGGGGVIVKVASATSNTASSTSTVIPFDTTIPQNTEGAEVMTCAITPSHADNKLKIDVTVYGDAASYYGWAVALFKDSDASAIATAPQISWDGGSLPEHITFTHYRDAGSTSLQTFKVRAGPVSGTLWINQALSGAATFGGTLISTIVITEIDPAGAGGGGLSDGDYGDITVSGGGGALTIDNDTVTFAKMQNVAANSVLARAANSSGDVSEVALGASELLGRGSTGDVAAIALGSGLSMTGTTLEAIEQLPSGTYGDIVVLPSTDMQVVLADDAPSTPAADTVRLFRREIANRQMPAFIGPAGLDSALQPFIARNKVGYWCPPGNGTTVPGVLGFIAPTVTGFTATARNVATTNMFTRVRRLGYVTAAAAGTVGQWRCAAAQYTVGDGATQLGGFHYIVRFGISDASAVSDARMFMGIGSSITPTNVEPSTLTQRIGVGHGASDTNLKLFYGGSSAQTPIDLGANFPSNTLSTDVYELALFSPPNSGDVHWQVTRVNTGHVASGTITNSGATVLPTNTTLLTPWGYRTNNATALAVGLDVMIAYIETDN